MGEFGALRHCEGALKGVRGLNTRHPEPEKDLAT